MLSDRDLKRLDLGASRMMSQVLPAICAFGALVLIAGAAMHLWLVGKFAAAAGMPFREVIALQANAAQLYPGATVRAAEHLCMAFWEFLYGLFFLVFTLSLRGRARFYERLRVALQAQDA